MARRHVRPTCQHAAPLVYRGEVFMDWHTHCSAARPGPCRACGRLTTLLDCTGALCHKTCAEREATRELATPVRRRARGHLSVVGAA